MVLTTEHFYVTHYFRNSSSEFKRSRLYYQPVSFKLIFACLDLSLLLWQFIKSGLVRSNSVNSFELADWVGPDRSTRLLRLKIFLILGLARELRLVNSILLFSKHWHQFKLFSLKPWIIPQSYSPKSCDENKLFLNFFLFPEYMAKSACLKNVWFCHEVLFIWIKLEKTNPFDFHNEVK